MDLPRLISDHRTGQTTIQHLTQSLTSAGEAAITALLSLDDGEMAFLGPDIWEAVVVLCVNQVPAADIVLARVISLSKPRELLISWAAVNVTMTHSGLFPSLPDAISPHKEAQDFSINHAKLLSCQCLAGLVEQLDSRNYASLVQESLSTFQCLLCMEAEGTPEYRTSPYIGQIMRILTIRAKEAMEEPMRKAYIELGVVFLGLLDSIFHPNCVDLISEFIPNLQFFLLGATSFHHDSSSPTYTPYIKGLLQLASFSPALSLPAVLSPLYILQLFLPIIHLGLFQASEQAIVLLDQLTTSTVRFFSVLSPFLYFPKHCKPTSAFLLDMLELMGRTQEDGKRKRTLGVFKRLLSLFDEEVRSSVAEVCADEGYCAEMQPGPGNCACY